MARGPWNRWAHRKETMRRGVLWIRCCMPLALCVSSKCAVGCFCLASPPPSHHGYGRDLSAHARLRGCRLSAATYLGRFMQPILGSTNGVLDPPIFRPVRLSVCLSVCLSDVGRLDVGSTFDSLLCPSVQVLKGLIEKNTSRDGTCKVS